MEATEEVPLMYKGIVPQKNEEAVPFFMYN